VRVDFNGGRPTSADFACPHAVRLTGGAASHSVLIATAPAWRETGR
jgi:hypothetical protein